MADMPNLQRLLEAITDGDEGAAQQLDEHIEAMLISGYPGKTEFTIRVSPDSEGNLKTSVDQRTRIHMPQDRRVFSKHRVIAVTDDGELHALEDYPPGPHHPEDVDRTKFED